MTATMPVVRAAPAIALLLFGVSASSAGSPRQYEDYHDSAIRPSNSPPRPRGHLKKSIWKCVVFFFLSPRKIFGETARGDADRIFWMYSRPASAEHFQQCAEFLPLRNRALVRSP